ncbi:MAG TPA: PAS domain-containing protein [Burkholderiales bacterium]|nr:PAS domain-containing protein [Burkholderiales bacterium]
MRLLLDPWLGVRVPFITVFGAVIVAAWFGGFWPAVLAAAAGYAAAHTLYDPGLLFAPAEMAAFSLSSVLIASVGGAMRRAAARAQASDERFRKFMENSPACVFIKDAAGRYVFMNAAAQSLVGTSDWRGKTDDELLPVEVARTVRANDARVLAADAPATFALTYPAADGPRHFHSTKFLLRDADGSPLVGSITVDVTEQARSAQEMRLIADTMSVGVVRCSSDLRYIWANRVFAGWAGRSPEEMTGLPIQAVIGADGLAANREHFERVLRGERVSYERVADFPQLHSRWIHAVAEPTFDAAGRPDGWVGVVSDIHERKQAEEARSRMEEALREADRRKDEFLATLAHELRNPLAPVRNAVAILAKKAALDPELAWSREVIDRQVDHMSRLIDDLLDLARIGSGKLRIRKERIALERAIDLALETSRPNITAAGHRLSVLLPSERVMLDADPTRLAQVLSNLLNNAARYTEGRGAISLSAEMQGRHLAIAVEDNGIGFPPEVAGRLFQPFSQLTSAHERSHGGLGIGLSLVHGIVELHGGTVQARSAGPGKGSEFIVRLPLPGRAERPAEPQPAAPAASAPAPSLRVLVADDNRDAADSLQRILAIYGHDVRVAYDGAAAICMAGEFRPHAAVLDIGMPGANGYEVARALREHYGTATTLIALTGWGQEGDRRRALDAGFDYHLTKPVEPGALNDLLANVGR